ncbi:MAG: SLC26A/SulP transporter family protein [Pseudorhodoplanes sp.]|nr:SLC26A/SulP transporter family protein [Pseudorhodoplanes sp.]
MRDVLAGLVASIALIANIISFGALMFPGDMSVGAPTVIWAMLIGTCICGIVIALTTSLPPIAVGIDSPTGIVLALLSASAGAYALAHGATPREAADVIMLIFTITTVMIGVIFSALGFLRWSGYFRFVPYFVVCGFLAATGWFLVAGALRMTTGRQLTLSGLMQPWSALELWELAAALAVLAVLLGIRRWIKSAFAMPLALIVMGIGGIVALRVFGTVENVGRWYFPSMGALSPWYPLAALRADHAGTVAVFLPEMIAALVVSLISLITKVSSIETVRQTAGDLDRELRGHGLGNLAAAPLGGITASLQTGTSRLLEQAGGATRASGVFCSLTLGAVGLANLDLLQLVPLPLIAGLVFFLGYTFILDGLWRPYAQKAWLDLILAFAIMAVCVRFGYLTGVLAGVVAACLMFAISYARVGIMRRHLTRAQFSSYVERDAGAAAYLREKGEAIQIYWLSGYIFFGSSEAILERIRADIEALPPRRVSYVILDFSQVSGADTSTGASLAKLRHFCNRQNITLVYCALAARNLAALRRGGFVAGNNKVFEDANLALAWCEDQLLAKAGLEPGKGQAAFEDWLQQQLGERVKATDLMTFLERRDLVASQVLYRQGEPADTIDLIAAGNVAIDVAREGSDMLRVRRMTTHTVLGEMGFFRRTPRSATVSADAPATLYTLTRDNFERMRRERPDLASAFDDFIIRTLAERVEFANRGVAALSRQRQ